MISLKYHVIECAPGKIGEYRSDIPQCSKQCMLKKLDTLHLTSKICLSFDIPYPLKLTVSLEPHTQKKCLLPKTENVHRKISEHVFVPNVGYCLILLL